jgi:hypothetical protein
MTVAANKHPQIASVLNQIQLSKPTQKHETSQVIIVNESKLINNEVEDDVKEHLIKTGSYIRPKSHTDSDYWEGAPKGLITAIGGIDAGKDQFKADVEFRYKKEDQIWHMMIDRYRMIAMGYPPKYRANINIEFTSAGHSSGKLVSPDAMWQDNAWHSYERIMRVQSDLTSGFRMGIEVDFDGPDGGGWFWTYKNFA